MRKAKAVSDRRLWPLLVLAPFATAYGKDQQDPASSAPEFIDFLEYLGSWDGQEQEWIQFLETEQGAPVRDTAGKEADVHEGQDDVVS